MEMWRACGVAGAPQEADPARCKRRTALAHRAAADKYLGKYLHANCLSLYLTDPCPSVLYIRYASSAIACGVRMFEFVYQPASWSLTPCQPSIWMDRYSHLEGSEMTPYMLCRYMSIAV